MRKCEVCNRTSEHYTIKFYKRKIYLCEPHERQMKEHGKVWLGLHQRNQIIGEYPDYKVVGIFSKEGGKEAEFLISNCDIELIKKHVWRISSYGYLRTQYKHKELFLHREILKPQKDEQVDHINHNKMDNRRSNLRIVSRSQNARNKKHLTGIFFGSRPKERRRDKWWVRFNIPAKSLPNGGRKMLWLGYFNTQEEAVIARAEKEIEYYGDLSPRIEEFLRKKNLLNKVNDT